MADTPNEDFVKVRLDKNLLEEFMKNFIYVILLASCGQMPDQRQSSKRQIGGGLDSKNSATNSESKQQDATVNSSQKPAADLNLSYGTGGAFGETAFQFQSASGTTFESKIYVNQKFAAAGMNLLVYIPSSSGTDYKWMFDNIKTLADQTSLAVATLRPVDKSFESLTADDVVGIHDMIEKKFVRLYNIKLDNIRLVGSSQGATFLTKSLLAVSMPYAQKVFGMAICDAKPTSTNLASQLSGMTFAVSDDDFTKPQVKSVQVAFQTAGISAKNFAIPNQGHCRFDGKDLIGKFSRGEI